MSRNFNSTTKLPDGWRWMRLGEVIAEAQPGFACGERDPNGLIQLRMNNVDTRGNFVWNEFLRVPFDKNQIKDIEKAINASNLGLSVATDDMGIRVIFPQLTTETRQNLVKVLKDKLEEQRITVRRERERVWQDVEVKHKEGKLTDDDKFRAKDELQKIIDEANKSLEASFEKKQKEVLG